MLLAVLLAATALATVNAAPASAQAPVFTFTGGGWGHGVGMSQYGAKGRADAGHSAAQILAAYYPGTQLSTIPPTSIRVLLTTVPGDLEIVVEGSGTVLRNGTQALGPGTHAIARGDFVELQGTIVRVPAAGHRYRHGRITLTASGNVVNTLDMQQYLYGLAEVPSSWPIEAQRAQAIAGRTYAWRRVQNPRNAEYDILSSTSDQAYSGYDKESAGGGWITAVDSTNGQVLTFNGAPAETYYSSSNGGWSERSGYVFSADRPYLQVVVDPFDNAQGNPNFRWTRSYTGDELAQYLRASFGVDVGTVTAVDFSGNFGGSGRIDRATVRLTGTLGSRSITGAQFRQMINAANPSLSRQLLSTLLFFRPMGAFDAVSFEPSGIRVQGWTFVQGLSDGGLAHVYVNGGFAGSGRGVLPRPDVAAAVPGADATTGFSFVVPPQAARNNVCVYAVTPSGNANQFLGCREIVVPIDPFGALDVAARTPAGIRVAGWAIDPNTAAPTGVHVYVNGQLRAAFDAAGNRPDVGAAFPGYGNAHGFDVTVPLAGTVNTVCAYAINAGAGENRLIACRTVTARVDPFGALDVANGRPDGIDVAGWAIDPDTPSPIDVHVYVDGAFAGAVHANGNRPDVGAAFAGYGNAHGFNASVPASPGQHQVCVYGINAGPGGNTLIACRTVSVPGNPIGSLDVVGAVGGGIRVAGWAIDPNTASPIDVHIYVGANGTAVRADVERPDVGAAFPGYGSRHGFDVVVPGSPGATVCAYGINVGAGSNTLLGCRRA
ncbi:MAG TPA: SpoIID/LytB domain-containing protein [Acidimicrobiales bacterium]